MRKNVISSDIKTCFQRIWEAEKKSHFCNLPKSWNVGGEIVQEKLIKRLEIVMWLSYSISMEPLASVFIWKNEVTLGTLILNEFDDKTRFFSLFFAILNLLQIEFLFIFKFSNFRFFSFSLSLSLPRTHATPPLDIKKNKRLFKMIIKMSNKDTQFKYHCPCILTLPTVQITFL